MNCSIEGCPGEFEAATIMHTVLRKGPFIVIDHVPAYIRSLCGDALLKSDAVRKIESLLLEKDQPATTVPPFEFT